PAVMRERKPSIAVLPFENLSGDPAQDYFADGVTEDIITALARFRWFFVVSRNSSFAFRGRPAGIREIASALGVRYLLEGSVRRSAGNVRIAAHLVDAASAIQLWAERYDFEGGFEVGEMFSMQDRIAERVAGAIRSEEHTSELQSREKLVRRPSLQCSRPNSHTSPHTTLFRSVRYLHDGSVRRSAGNVRIAAHLVDAASAIQLWAERYDFEGGFEVGEMFSMQDRIAERVAGAI